MVGQLDRIICLACSSNDLQIFLKVDNCEDVKHNVMCFTFICRGCGCEFTENLHEEGK